MEERIQKILSRMGIASRRKAEEMIREGRVTVNGQIATLGMKADPDRDHIKVDGKLLIRPEPKAYIIMNKPKGVLTTLEDPEGRPTVKELLKGVKFRVYPVGRLDFNSEGLLIFTNDGELAYRLIHPKFKVPKTYLVKVKGIVEERKLDILRKGIRLEEGVTAPADIKKVFMPKTKNNTWLEITIYEGKKRQIRRMFEKIRHPVLKLKRIKIDGIELGRLEPGQWRYLTPTEVKRLKVSVGL
jgi:23S rRNA pseudouridine2605 synthase